MDIKALYWFIITTLSISIWVFIYLAFSLIVSL